MTPNNYEELASWAVENFEFKESAQRLKLDPKLRPPFTMDLRALQSEDEECLAAFEVSESIFIWNLGRCNMFKTLSQWRSLSNSASPYIREDQ